MKNSLKNKGRQKFNGGSKKSGKKKYDFGGILSKESAAEVMDPDSYLLPVNGFWAY